MITKVEQLEAELEIERSKQIFCTFISPGTMFAETSRYEVEKADIKAALAILKEQDIKERHGAKPHSFRFEDGNGKPLAQDGDGYHIHFITGRVFTRDEIDEVFPAKDDNRATDNRILHSNMESEPVAIYNTNSFGFTGLFGERDCVVDLNGNITRRGNDPDLVKCRKGL